MPNASTQSPEEIREKWNNIPDWDRMVYLYQWCASLEETVRQQQLEIRSLQEKLDPDESKATQTSE